MCSITSEMKALKFKINNTNLSILLQNYEKEMSSLSLSLKKTQILFVSYNLH